MAVTVKIDDKKKVKKTSKAAPSQVQAAASLDDYTLPKEKKSGIIVFLTWIGLMTLFSVPWLFNENTQPIGQGMLAWWFLSTAGYMFVWPMMIVRRLRVQGAEAAIDASTQPRLHALLVRASGLLGVDVPEAFLEAEGSPRVYVLPRAVLVRAAANKMMEPGEINCLVVRGLVMMRQRQARRFALLRLVDDSPKIVRFLVWPVGLYALLLRNQWVPHAHETTDRLALLLVNNESLLISAILKEYAATDANMQEMNITTGDVTNWINQAGHIGMAGEEISTQYKLGRAIHEDPELEHRLLVLQEWAKSEKFRDAVAELKKGRSSSTAPTAPQPASS